MGKILIIDDERSILQSLTRELSSSKWDIQSHWSAAEGLNMIVYQEFDIVISDYRMPEMNGVEFLRKVKRSWPLTIRIILSGYTDVDSVVSSINDAEIYRYITKPWNSEELMQTLVDSMRRRERLMRAHKLIEQEKSANDDAANLRRELEKLEAEEPGITKVEWGPNDTVRLDVEK